MIDKHTDLKAACEAVEQTGIRSLIERVHMVQVRVHAEPDVLATLTPEAALDLIRDMERHGYHVGQESIVYLIPGTRSDLLDEAIRPSLGLDLSRAVRAQRYRGTCQRH